MTLTVGLTRKYLYWDLRRLLADNSNSRK